MNYFLLLAGISELMTDLVLGVGQAIVSDLHRDITRQQTVPQSQVTGDRGNHGKIGNVRFLYS